jgi:CubicO group peptidase (beta-lactamase class C family)
MRHIPIEGVFMFKRISSIVVAVLLLSCGVHAQNDTAARMQRFENGLGPPVRVKGETGWNLLERMNHYKVPGVSIAVIDDFKIVWAKGYGVADLATKAPVTERTLFQAASISKTLNATAIMREVQDGRLSLDENVNTYLRAWKLPDNEFTSAKKVTIANLLSHTGGTTVSGFPGYEMGAPLPTVVQILEGQPPANTPPIIVDTAPGVAFRYSGGGTTILQLLLTELENRPYPEIMKAMILDPLGMTGSAFCQPPTPEIRALASTGYLRNGQPVEGKYHVYPELAAAGLWTNPTDLARFAIEHQLSLAGRSNKLLSSQTEEKMITPYLSGGYGLGFGIQRYGDEIYFSHGGGNFGFRCMLIAHAKKGYGAIVMTNGSSDVLLGEIIRSIAAEYSWDGYLNEPYELRAVSPDRLRRFAGRYLLDVDQVATVDVDGDHLKVDVTGEPSIELYPIADDEFIRLDRDGKVRFMPGPERSRDSIVVIERGGGLTLPRMGDAEKIPYEHLISGDIEEAMAAYRRIWDTDSASSAVAETRLNALGYAFMGEGKLKEAIAILSLNVEFYPSSANAYDSLGEAYMNNGEKEPAMRNYTKSLELNPDNANAVEILKKLRE